MTFIVFIFLACILASIIFLITSKQQRVASRLINTWSGCGLVSGTPELYKEMVKRLIRGSKCSLVCLSVNKKGDIEYVAVELVDDKQLTIRIGREIKTVCYNLAHWKNTESMILGVVKKENKQRKIISVASISRCATWNK